jgi:hypothetical protein
MTEPIRSEQKNATWTRLLAGALFVIVISGFFAYIMRDTAEPAKPPASSDIADFDSFDRSGSGGALGQTAGQRVWSTRAGAWDITNSVAHPARAGAVSNFATVDIGANASISVSTTGPAACGIVATFIDLSNFVALERNDQRNEWDMLLVRDGKTTVIGAVPGVSPNNNRVTLLVSPPIVSAISGNNRISFVVENLPGGTQAGIYAIGTSASLCTFDDVSLLTPIE